MNLKLLGVLLHDVLTLLVNKLLVFLIHLRDDALVVVLEIVFDVLPLSRLVGLDLLMLALELLGLVLVLVRQHLVLLGQVFGSVQSVFMELVQILVRHALLAELHKVEEAASVEGHNLVVVNPRHLLDLLLVVLVAFLEYFAQLSGDCLHLFEKGLILRSFYGQGVGFPAFRIFHELKLLKFPLDQLLHFRVRELILGLMFDLGRRLALSGSWVSLGQ